MHNFNMCNYDNHHSFAQLICVSLCHIPNFGLSFSCYALRPDSSIPVTVSLLISTGFGGIC